MLDQKAFGAKLRNHRKNRELTQEEVADRLGVSPQAVSKWEAGDCLPDCYNLKAIGELYNISVDVLLDTETDACLELVAARIEQLATEYLWANATDEERNSLRKQTGDSLWQMWKTVYFSEVGDRKLQQESKMQGNLRIGGDYGMKVWDDAGVACVVKSALVKNMQTLDCRTLEVLSALCSREGQALVCALGDNGNVVEKEALLQRTKMEPSRLNEMLLLLSENRVVEFVCDKRITPVAGYKLSAHCGIVAHMILAAGYLLEKTTYTVSEYLHCQHA